MSQRVRVMSSSSSSPQRAAESTDVETPATEEPAAPTAEAAALNGTSGAAAVCAKSAWTMRPTPFGSALHSAAAPPPPCLRSDEAAAASTALLAKPRLTLKPSGLAAVAATATLPTTQPASAAEPAVPSVVAAAEDAVAPSAAATGGDSSGSTFLRSARLVCSKPPPSAAEVTRADSNVGSERATDGSACPAAFSSAEATSSTDERPKASVLPLPACGGSAGGFLFGQNLGERVTNADQPQQQIGGATAGAAAQPSDSGDFIFGSNLDDRVEKAATPTAAATAITASPTASDGQAASAAAAKPKQSLEDAASEYERLRNGGPRLPEVEVVTGEEEESNVLQASCRLFCFDKERSSYAERGRGLLRLNDNRRGGLDGFRSRIVMRTSGILRVILNTKIWSGMLCEKINQKSLRITGMEDGVVRVFLVTATPKDIDGLLSAVQHRVDRLRRQEEQQHATLPATPTAKNASSTDGGADASSSSRKRQTDGGALRDDEDDGTSVAPRSPSKKARADEAGQSPEADDATSASA